jgi:F0F1-type ATP synthase beta subunit
MAIPVTLAPSKRVFSIAGNLISKKQTRITSKNVRYVLCLRSWGLLVKDNDKIEVIIDEEGRIIDLIVPVVSQGGPIIID